MLGMYISSFNFPVQAEECVYKGVFFKPDSSIVDVYFCMTTGMCAAWLHLYAIVSISNFTEQKDERVSPDIYLGAAQKQINAFLAASKTPLLHQAQKSNRALNRTAKAVSQLTLITTPARISTFQVGLHVYLYCLYTITVFVCSPYARYEL